MMPSGTGSRRSAKGLMSLGEANLIPELGFLSIIRFQVFADTVKYQRVEIYVTRDSNFKIIDAMIPNVVK